MPSNIVITTAVRVIVVSSMLAMSLPSFAQVDEIIVTARKRQENLQDVPISISVLSAADIKIKGINSLVEVTKNVSSLEFDEGFAQSDTRIVIRGLSAITGRQNAATLVDGIDVSTESISSGGGSILLVNRLVDIERIEVVKGPQMAQYGRSAFNGAIQYVTKDPSDQLEVEIGADHNNQEQYNVTASVSGPLFGDLLGARLAGTWWDESGLYSNTITGAEIGSDEGFALSLSLLSRPLDNLSFKFRTEYQNHQSKPSAVAFLPFNSEIDTPQAALDTLVLGCFPAIVDKTRTPAVDDRTARVYDPNFTDIESDDGPFCESPIPFVSGEIPVPTESQIRLGTNPFDPGQDFEGFDHQIVRLSLVANWDLEKGSFTSWTGFTYDDTFEAQDAGEFGVAGPPPYLDDNVNNFIFEQDKETRQISQEFRYDTNFDGPANLSLGGLYWEERVDNQANSLTVQASGSHCAWDSRTGFTFDDLGFVTDGSGCYGYTEIPVAPFVGGNINFGDGQPYAGIGQIDRSTPTDRNTEHRSVYGMFEFEFAKKGKLTLEGRLNQEELEQFGPVFLNPSASGGASNWSVCGIFFRECDADFLFHAPGTFGPADVGGPFWSQENFEAAYDQWDPDAPVSAADPRLRKDAIPSECLQDPGVQARLANNQQGGEDPFDLFNPSCTGKLERDDTWIAPKVTLDWQLTQDSMLYTSWAKAEKPGGFATGTIGSNGLNRAISEFEPEVMEVYELGMRSAWLDGTLIFNATGFFQDYSDKQTVISTLGNDGRPVAKIANAAAAEIWGVELDANWAPISPFLGGQWAFNAGYTWLDSEYVNAEFDSIAALTITMAGNCRPTTLESPVTGSVIPACVISYNGNSLEGAPEGKFVGSMDYVLPISGDLEITAGIDFRWVDKRFVEVSNRSYVDAYSNTDLRFGVRGAKWELLAYVNNVFDDDSVHTAFSGRPGIGCCFTLGSGLDISEAQPTPDRVVMVDLGFTSTAIVTPPRIIGLRATLRFGEN